MTKIGTREEYYKIKGNKKVYGQNDCPFCDLEKIAESIVWKGKILVYYS